MVRTYTLKTESSGRLRKVRCVVYDDIEQLRASGMRWNPTGGDLSQALAVSQGAYTYSLGEDGQEIPAAESGYVRLFRGRMGAAVVSHEMLHMACVIYQQDWLPEHGPPDKSMENEEVLCHIMSDLVEEANRKFWKAGIYK